MKACKHNYTENYIEQYYMCTLCKSKWTHKSNEGRSIKTHIDNKEKRELEEFYNANKGSAILIEDNKYNPAQELKNLKNKYISMMRKDSNYSEDEIQNNANLIYGNNIHHDRL